MYGLKKTGLTQSMSSREVIILRLIWKHSRHSSQILDSDRVRRGAAFLWRGVLEDQGRFSAAAVPR